MPLPPLNESGDLPEGIHRATIGDIVSHFGSGSNHREAVTANLERIYRLALKTGSLDRLIIFGSYITAKLEPNDVDVILVMSDEFDHRVCASGLQALFDHRRASEELGASCFWIRPAMLFGESLDEFIAGWSVKREGGRRGLLEVIHDS